MTRESLWTNSAPLAALSSHWWSHNVLVGLMGMPYAQDTRAGLLEEYKLPFLRHFDRTVQVAAIIPANLRYRSDVGTSQETINSRVWQIHDSYSGTEITGVGGTGGLYFIDYLRVREGRDAACHRGRAILSTGGFSQQVGIDYEPWTDAIGFDARALQSRYVTALAMFVPRSGGETAWGGVYACVRPVVRRALIPQLGTEIDHTDMWLPPCDLYEIGELTNAQMVSRDRVVKPARKPGQTFLFADLGLAIRQDGDQAEMLFSCNAGMSVLEFQFTPESRDAMLAATIDREDSPFSYQLSFGENYFVGLTRCPFSGLWQFRGFPLITADHGGIVHLSHFAGAASTPPYHDVGPDVQRALPRAPEWGTWPQSMYPYTPHANAIAALEDGVRLADKYPSRVKKTPIYSVFEHAPGDLEMYPSREVVAFAACLQPTQFGPVYSPYTSLANNMLAKPPNNGMVVCGKQIKSVTVRFEPCAADVIKGVAVGISPIAHPAAIGGSFPQIPSATGWVDDTFWYLSQTIPLPEGSVLATFEQRAVIYNGTYVGSRPRAIDAISRQDVQKGVIDAATENAIVLMERCLLDRNLSIGGANSPQTIAGLHSGDIRDGSGTFNFAPLTGQYKCERFSLDQTPVDGSWFRYSGSGGWLHDGEIQYNAYLPVLTVNDRWLTLAQGPPPLVAIDRSGRTPAAAPVTIVEHWSLRTDHIEMYAELSVRTQEAGQFDASQEIAVVPFDEPVGRLNDIVTYTEGNEPRPALRLFLQVRSHMRGDLSMEVDTSGVPIDYPWSLPETSSQKVINEVGGIAGRFVGNQWVSLDDGNSPFAIYEHQFNADQTELLLSGETVTATRWMENVPNPGDPAVFVAGAQRQYKVSVALEFH